jgi:hypothetical protein
MGTVALMIQRWEKGVAARKTVELKIEQQAIQT